MIKTVQKKAEKSSFCFGKIMGLALLLLGSSLYGMHPAAAQAQEAAVLVVHNEEDPVVHWDRVSVLLTGSDKKALEDEYSKQKLGAVLSALRRSPVGTIGRVAYDDLVRVQVANAQLESEEGENAQMADLYDAGSLQRAKKCMLPILAELYKQNNERQELAKSKRRMNCSCCSWWWLLNWSSRLACAGLIASFSNRFQCNK